MMWKLADFLGIEVLDYVVMGNHYHQLIKAPASVDIDDLELRNRLRAYYGPDHKKVAMFDAALERGGLTASKARGIHLRRMGNISEFEKVLKQKFSRWYNKRNKRKGTLWMERFKSLLLEDCVSARTTVAAYIDLNPVRAKMVADPKDYRHCGYGAAIGGDQRCRDGIMQITGIENWKKAAADYRKLLMQRGNVQVEGKRGSIDRKLLLETLEMKGHLPRSQLLRLKVRFLTDGLVLGSEDFVEEIFNQYRDYFGTSRKTGSRPMCCLSDASLRVIRDLRMEAVS